MKILPAAERHVEAVAGMMEEFFAFHAALQPDYYRPVDDCRAYPRAALHREEGVLLVAEEGAETVGFLNVIEDLTPPFETFIPYRHATVVDLYVDPAHRHNGVGSALLDAAEDWSRERGLSYLELNVLTGNENAYHFYQSSGFAPTSQILRRFVK